MIPAVIAFESLVTVTFNRQTQQTGLGRLRQDVKSTNLRLENREDDVGTKTGSKKAYD